MLKKASEIIALGDDRAVVDFAIEANRELSTIGGELEKAKGHLRKVALGRTTEGADQVEIEGGLGVATVVLGGSNVKPRKGQDLRDIEANLSEETFRRLFTKKVTVSPLRDYAIVVASVTGPERETLDRFIEVTPSTPKVFLPR